MNIQILINYNLEGNICQFGISVFVFSLLYIVQSININLQLL